MSRLYSAEDEAWSYYGAGRRSDLEWGLSSKTTVEAYDPRGRGGGEGETGGWACGDRRRVRRLVSQFLDHSSIHGVRYLCPRDPKTSCLRKSFYRLFFAASAVALLVNVAQLAQQSFKAESVFISSTSKEVGTGREEDEHFPEFPTLLLCRSPAYRADADVDARELLDYALLSLGYPFLPLTPDERGLLVDMLAFPVLRPGATLPADVATFSDRLDGLKARYEQMRSGDVSFNLTRFIVDNAPSCEDVFSRCLTFVAVRNCCEMFRPRLTSQGVCFSFEISRETLDFYRDIGPGTFTFTFDLRPTPHPDKALTTGYQIHLFDPRDRELTVLMEGDAILNGFATNMKTRLVKTSRVALHTAWHGLSHDCPTLPSHLDPGGYGDRYFRSSCQAHYTNRMTRKRCGCRGILDAGNSGSPLRVCDPEDMYRCFVSIALQDNLTDMHRVCREPCVEYDYKSEVRSFRIGGDEVCRLVFMYESTQYSLHEYKTTTVSGFLSQIGGALGLYLGASAITAVELLVFLVSWLWHRFAPRRRREDGEEDCAPVNRKARGGVNNNTILDKNFCT